LSLVYEALLLLAVLFAGSFAYFIVSRLLPFTPPRSAFQAYLIVLAAAYFITQWMRGGQTLPMKTWHIRLVSRDGTAISARQASIRYIAGMASWLMLGAGYLWAIADPDGQFLHDRLAGTRLVAMDES
jgi:uncharacterized RDD family membrane protein YckC